MIAIHNPTNTVDRCSCAIAKIVNGRKFEKIATPKQKNQYFADLLKLNNSTLKKTENKIDYLFKVRHDILDVVE